MQKKRKRKKKQIIDLQEYTDKKIGKASNPPKIPPKKKIILDDYADTIGKIIECYLFKRC